MSLKTVIGQDRIINILMEAKRQNNVFHAYVFEGPEGVGKKYAAFNFAKALLCLYDEEDACEICASCKKMASKNHPDYHMIGSEGNSIKDAQVEEIQNTMSKKPFEGERIITVIDHADAMTVRAQNRLLKTLEDPTPNTIMILLTQNASMLLPTITSRCMILKFTSIPDKQMRTYLIEKYALDKEEANVLASFSKGCIGRAEKLLMSEDFKERRRKSIQMAVKLGSFTGADIFNIMDEIREEKDNIIEFIDMIEYWYRDLIIIEAAKFEKEALINIDYLDTLLQETNKIGYEEAMKIISIIENTKRDLNMHLNFNLVIKNMLLKIQEA